MANLGSAFLGDSNRRRFLSNSTPPSSPPFSATSHSSPRKMASMSPPTSASSAESNNLALPSKTNGQNMTALTIHPMTINPELSLELRLRWLEALLVGVGKGELGAVSGHPTTSTSAGASSTPTGTTLVRSVEELQNKLNECVVGNDGIKRFMDQYEQYAHFLTPAFALSEPPSYETMSATELNVLLGELEPDVRNADRDLREIEALENKGVLEAGRLGEHEALEERVKELSRRQVEDEQLAQGLERRIVKLVEELGVQADALSELFVDWDDTLTAGEDRLAAIERERVERRRLGME